LAKTLTDRVDSTNTIDSVTLAEYRRNSSTASRIWAEYHCSRSHYDTQKRFGRWWQPSGLQHPERRLCPGLKGWTLSDYNIRTEGWAWVAALYRITIRRKIPCWRLSRLGGRQVSCGRAGKVHLFGDVNDITDGIS
jgi:hypothetical protein